MVEENLPEPAENPAENPPPPDAAELHLRLVLEPGTRLQVTLQAVNPAGETLETRCVTLENATKPGESEHQPETTGKSAAVSLSLRDRLRLLNRPSLRAGWPALLIILALGVYLAVRLIALPEFPIYFFTDEAIQTMRAADLIRDGFRGYDKELLPTYFQNGGQYNLSLSVYLQVIPTVLFGKSVFVTRAVSVFISLLAAAAVGLTLKQVFHSSAAWSGVLLLGLMPAWFLHSRTAFETVLAVSFYAAFLFAYLRYRGGSLRWLYAAAVLAALTFYSYSPAQLVVGVTVVLLALSDLRYHWQNRALVLRAALLGLLLAVPYIRFQINHSGETLNHLRILGSYWIQKDLTLIEKLGRYFGEYTQGLNPLYWYSAKPDGLARHIMKGYGHLWRPALPFTALGLALAVIRIKKPAYRVVLVSLLAAPTGAALVGLGITRLLFVIVPAALLTGIGFSAALEALFRLSERRFPRLPARLILSLLVFSLLAAASFAMLGDALTNGPTWFNDYTLTGLQYGARQIFPAAQAYQEQHPDRRILLSPSWANGTDVIARFFLPEGSPIRLGAIDGYFDTYQPISAQDVFIMTPQEMERVQKSEKFTNIQVDQILNYPNGTPGFYFTRLQYVENIQDIFKGELERRKQLIQASVTLPDGAAVRLEHSGLDMGEIKNAFDGDPASLVRTLEANPLKIWMTLPGPRPVQGLTLRVGGVPTRVTVRVFTSGSERPAQFMTEVEESTAPRNVSLNFDTRLQAERIEIEVLSVRDSEPAHVHLWEVTLE